MTMKIQYSSKFIAWIGSDFQMMNTELFELNNILVAEVDFKRVVETLCSWTFYLLLLLYYIKEFCFFYSQFDWSFTIHQFLHFFFFVLG